MNNKNKKKKKRVILQNRFNIFFPLKRNYPIFLFDSKEINLDEIIGVVLYKDEDTKEWLLFLVKRDEDFFVLTIPDAIANLIDKKARKSVIIMNAKFEDIEKSEGKLVPLGRKI